MQTDTKFTRHNTLTESEAHTMFRIGYQRCIAEGTDRCIVNVRGGFIFVMRTAVVPFHELEKRPYDCYLHDAVGRLMATTRMDITDR
jgi:hypothetical protein